MLAFRNRFNKVAKAKAMMASVQGIHWFKGKCKKRGIQSFGLFKALYTYIPWQTCSFQRHLHFSGKHSAMLQLLGDRPGFDSTSTIPTPADPFDSDSNSNCLSSIPTPADFCDSDSNSSCLSSIPTPVQLLIPILTPAQLLI